MARAETSIFPWRDGASPGAGGSGDAGDEGNARDASALLTASSPRVGILVSISAQPHTINGAHKNARWSQLGTLRWLARKHMLRPFYHAPARRGSAHAGILREPAVAAIREAGCDQMARHVILAWCVISGVVCPDAARR